MSRLVWGEPDKRFYETGVDRGVLYSLDGVGVPWNGLIAVSEAPSGADLVEGYFDGEKFRQQRLSGSFSATLSAYTYPREFEEYDEHTAVGYSRQPRKLFNLSYRTKAGNGYSPDAHHLIHLVYNAVASPATKSYSSQGTGVQVTPFEWQIDTVNEIFPSGDFSSHVIINTAIAYPWAVSVFEDMLYGSVNNDPHFPTVREVLDLFENASILRVTDHGDGTFTVDGPDEAIQSLGDNAWSIEWPSVVYLGNSTYQISSL